MSWIFLICSAVTALGRLVGPNVFRNEPILYSFTRCLTFAVSTKSSVQNAPAVSCTICPTFSSRVIFFRTLSTLFSTALSSGMALDPDVCPAPQDASMMLIEANTDVFLLIVILCEVYFVGITLCRISSESSESASGWILPRACIRGLPDERRLRCCHVLHRWHLC